MPSGLRTNGFKTRVCYPAFVPLAAIVPITPHLLSDLCYRAIHFISFYPLSCCRRSKDQLPCAFVVLSNSACSVGKMQHTLCVWRMRTWLHIGVRQHDSFASASGPQRLFGQTIFPDVVAGRGGNDQNSLHETASTGVKRRWKDEVDLVRSTKRRVKWSEPLVTASFSVVVFCADR